MAKKKKAFGLSRLNVFANSPLTVRVFGSLVAALMVISAGYGGYTLISEQFSSAKNKKLIWHWNSAGIKHEAGKKINFTYSSKSGKEVNLGSGWYANTSNSKDKYMWRGPGVNLPANKQYFGCFFYSLDTWGSTKAKAVLDVYDSKRKRVLNMFPASLHQYTDSGAGEPLGPTDLGMLGKHREKLTRTCLAFYIPKKWKDNKVELRLKILHASVFIRATKITHIPQKKTDLPNLWILKNQGNKDNRTILHGFKYN